MKNRIFIVAAILGLLATACKKENPQNDLAVTPITISASYGVSDGAKVSYTEDGNTISATWEEGDQLYVVYNGHLNTLTLTEGAGTTTATFTGTVIGTPTAMSVLICYVRDANNPLAVEVSATGEYTYTSGIFLAQDGTLASAAKCNLFYGTTTYGNGSNISCTFTPNTSMMKLTVFAPDGVSAGAEATLTYKSGTTELAKATFTVGVNGRNTIYLTVPAGEYTGEQTLVYHSGEANVTETLSDTQACFAAGQTYTASFGSPIIPEGAIDGRFTINVSGDQVYFSQGNLQYNKTTTKWSFMEHQYDMVETLNQNVGVDYTDQNVVSLFCYGTSGCNYGATIYQPWSTSTTYAQYCGSHLYDIEQADWGYNAIANGGNEENKWRTLTRNEWSYLFNTRTTSTVNNVANARYAKAQVAGVHGVILFPDNYTHPSGVNLPTGINEIGDTGWNGNNYTADNFERMEVNGAVFLPAAGYRLNSTIATTVGTELHYWTSYYSGDNNGSMAASVDISSGGLNPSGTAYLCSGLSVRLVRNVE